MPRESQSRLFATAPVHRVADMNSQIERIFFRSNASVNLVISFLLYVVLLAITYGILGSGLIDRSQKATAAAIQIADK
jgi:hypothetical protein